MGFLGGVFEKKECVICGGECGAMHRDKIKNKEYICSDCARKCSEWARVSEMDKETVEQHMQFMAKREKIFEQYLSSGKAYPSTINKYGIVFNDDAGFFAIINRDNPKNKVYHEVIRYDEVASYRYYEEENNPTDGGAATFKEDGIVISLVQPIGMTTEMEQKGLRSHPYIKYDIKLCFRNKERDTNYADNALQHFDYIFGVNDNTKGLFSFGMTKAEKRDLKATTDMVKLMGGIAKAAVNGEDGSELEGQFEETQKTVDDAATGGLAQYSRKADEIEKNITI